MTKNTIKGNNVSKPRSYNLEVSRSQSKQKHSSPQTQRYAVKNIHRGQQTSPIRNKKSSQVKPHNVKKVCVEEKSKGENCIFKYLIVVTSTIFTFGSFGFGYTLRYAHKWQQLIVNEADAESIIQGPEVIKQDIIKELRINN